MNDVNPNSAHSVVGTVHWYAVADKMPQTDKHGWTDDYLYVRHLQDDGTPRVVLCDLIMPEHGTVVWILAETADDCTTDRINNVTHWAATPPTFPGDPLGLV